MNPIIESILLYNIEEIKVAICSASN